jgi:hypothetical protein
MMRLILELLLIVGCSINVVAITNNPWFDLMESELANDVSVCQDGICAFFPSPQEGEESVPHQPAVDTYIDVVILEREKEESEEQGDDNVSGTWSTSPHHPNEEHLECHSNDMIFYDDYLLRVCKLVVTIWSGYFMVCLLFQSLGLIGLHPVDILYGTNAPDSHVEKEEGDVGGEIVTTWNYQLLPNGRYGCLIQSRETEITASA